MKATAFIPRLDALPSSQRALWPELGATPENFTLYGGTALALRLGHRISLDFDFFSNAAFDPDRLAEQIPYLKNAERIQVAANTLTCRVERPEGPVLISFFGDLGLGVIVAPDFTRDTGLRVASLLDIAGTKLSVIQKRAEKKDYLDIDALLEERLDLSVMLAAGKAIYGNQFNPLIALKALSFFDDLASLPKTVQVRIGDAVRDVDLTNLPSLIPYRKRVERDGSE